MEGLIFGILRYLDKRTPDLWDTVEIQSNMVILLTQWPLFITKILLL